MKILKELKSGWTFPPRAHKAHYFSEDGVSTCKKFTIKWSNGSAYLPASAMYESQCCKRCMKVKGLTIHNCY